MKRFCKTKNFKREDLRWFRLILFYIDESTRLCQNPAKRDKGKFLFGENWRTNVNTIHAIVKLKFGIVLLRIGTERLSLEHPLALDKREYFLSEFRRKAFNKRK